MENANTYSDGLVQLKLLFIIFVGVKGVQTNVVVNELFSNLFT